MAMDIVIMVTLILTRTINKKKAAYVQVGSSNFYLPSNSFVLGMLE